MLKALLFDLDGTLANTDPVHYETWKEIMAGYGLPIDPAFYTANFSGRLNEQIIQTLLPHLDAAAGEWLARHKEALFRERATLIPPMPGLFDLLNWMETHQLKRAIVTNAPVENVEFMVQSLGLAETFEVVILGDELPKGKPDPLPYQTALDQLEIAPHEAIAFEDSPSGIRSAIAAQIPTVAIASSHDPEVLRSLGSVLVVNDFAKPQLWDWLQRQLVAESVGSPNG